MKINTKFKVGDIVWFDNYGLNQIIVSKITRITMSKNELINNIEYYLDGYVDPFSEKELNLVEE
jgi:hypothetical protein